jgi:hypothetical protein
MRTGRVVIARVYPTTRSFTAGPSWRQSDLVPSQANDAVLVLLPVTSSANASLADIAQP